MECKTDKVPSNTVFKSFNESTRVSNGLGFTNNDIFIDRPLIEKFNIENDDKAVGKAVINFNKKRTTWGWKALSIEEVVK